MVGGWALQQLWLFWLAPVVGAVVAGAVYRVLEEESPATAQTAGVRAQRAS
jgi:aquaporin Z